MKFHLTISCVAICLFGYAQKMQYKTVKIAQWELEKFPISYIKKAATVYTEKDKFNGKLRYYEERNTIGRVEGLVVTIQKNYKFPYKIEYVINDEVVYRAIYFNDLNIASEIVNKNLEGQLNGPQLTRKKNYTTNKFEESITEYKAGQSNDALIAKNDIFLKFNKDSLLEGDFFMPVNVTDKWFYQHGFAKNGVIQRLKYSFDSKDNEYDLYENFGDSLQRTSKSKSDSLPIFYWKHKILLNRKITNAVSLKNNPNYFYYSSGRGAFVLDGLMYDTITSDETIEKYGKTRFN